ncbi:C6 zinc finger domain protein [Colletotrichum sojae]|uniref:C6 zinc finger domain protein n=1 Tax=Colletotrichum sojae TaxID=2175907 RepID=A0A8H6IM53_9PEZI|nr:C6 zinc finger domain protein [Colletotrichum sojae]
MPLDMQIPGTGVFSLDPTPRKPKRTRISASKVRTGCLTWLVPRIRHVKCDEAKPTCKRCKKDKHKCDGYANQPPPQAKRLPNAPSTATATTAMTISSILEQQRRSRVIMHLTPPVDWDISGTSLERTMFHHVNTCTVPDFGPATPLAKLWSNYILPLGYYSDSVKHAVIALGVAHRAFLEDPLLESTPSDSALALNDLANKHYRMAVAEAIRVMADPSPVNIRVTLACCLVFVCLEIVRGQYDKAVQHLRSGSKVLESLHQAALASRRDPLSIPPSERALVETVDRHFDQLCDVTNMFSCMGMDASMLVEDEVVPDLSFFTRPDDSDRTGPITSVSEARYQLHYVELAMSEAFDEATMSCSASCRTCPSECSSRFSTPASNSSKEAEWEEAERKFRTWCTRFEAFEAGLAESGTKMTPAEEDELKALRFSKRSWEVFNAHDTPCAMKDSDMSQLAALVDMAEDVILSKPSAARPSFSLAADAVPSLSYICAYCEDPALERRIIDLLRRMRRREGMWDSQEMANLYEFIARAKMDNTWKDEYNWESLPNLARMMSSLTISGRERSATPSPLTLL